MKFPLSIIIPAYNEGKYLPKLLKSIKNQTVKPEEVIVVDAYSDDNTAAIVKRNGYTIVHTSKRNPAHSRNLGANLASGKILLFLDADVVLPRTFLEKSLTEMVNEDLDVASCFVHPISSKKADVLLHTLVNYYMTFTKSFFQHAPGFCIFAYKDIHEQIKGFDESVYLAEDHGYVQKAAKIGMFSYLNSHKIPVSVRRLEHEGRWTIATKYIAAEFHLIFLGKIRKRIFSYKFGEYFK